MTLDEFFEGYPVSRELFDALWAEAARLGPVTLRISQSQVALCRPRIFARVWIPAMYLRGKSAPLVLTLGFAAPDPSPRWKEIVQPSPGHFTHRLELFSRREINAEVVAWLETAWQAA